MIDILPAIAESDQDAFAKKITLIPSGWVHVTVSDGTMGTPETLTDVQNLPTHLSFEAHLLCATPEKYIRPLVDAGFKRLIVHVECNDPRRFFDEAKFDEVEVGVALDGATEVEQVEPFLEDVDFVVVMTAEIGKDIFLPESIEKIKLIRQNYPDLPIEGVGGITEELIPSLEAAGATRIVISDYNSGKSVG